MLTYVAMVSAVVPSLLLMWYFHARDVFPEPSRVLWTTFALGIAAVVPVLLVSLPLRYIISFTIEPIDVICRAFLAAAFPEELCKLTVLLGYSFRHRAFNEPMDGIVYGVAASLGFATLENIQYVAHGGMAVAAGRALTAVPTHAFLGAIMGYYIGKARFQPKRRLALILIGLGMAILFHGLYDLPLMMSPEIALVTSKWLTWTQIGLIRLLVNLLSLVVLIIAGRLAYVFVQRNRKEQLKREVESSSDTAPALVQTAGTSTFGILRIVMGGLLASIGGTETLAFITTLIMRDIPSTWSIWAILGRLFLSVVVGIFGVWIFREGIRRLNRIKIEAIASESRDPNPIR